MEFQAEYGVAADFYVTLKTFGAQDFQPNPTLAAGDVKISIDGGAFVNITLPVVTPAAGKQVKVALSAAELTGKKITVHFIDQTGPKEWEDREISISTYGHASAQHTLTEDIRVKTDQLSFTGGRVDAITTSSSSTLLDPDIMVFAESPY